MREALVVAIPEKDQAFLKQFFELVNSRYADSEFEVKDMERELRMSKTQLLRKISALTGESPGRILFIHRMEQAKKMLDSRPDMNITEVAYSCGFGNPKHFSTAFKEFYGITPSVFKGRN